jgi:hypothetical protein
MLVSFLDRCWMQNVWATVLQKSRASFTHVQGVMYWETEAFGVSNSMQCLKLGNNEYASEINIYLL